MKYLSLLLIAILLLSLSSCACGKDRDALQAPGAPSSSNEAEDLVEAENTDSESIDFGDFDFGASFKFSTKYSDLCFEAISAADEHINGIEAPEKLKTRFTTIYVEMGAEYVQSENNMTYSGAICRKLVNELSWLVTMDDDESMETFIKIRNLIAEIAEKRT